MPNGVPQTGLMGAEQALQQGLQGSLGLIAQGLAPFADPGISAFQLQAAQAGALGPEAQARAISQFQESPGQQFLREEQERAILRNAAATGGLGGGNVLSELQRRAFERAQTDFGNQFSRLGSLSQIGAGLTGQGVAQGAQAVLGTGRDLATGRTRAGEQIAGQIAGTTSALGELLSQQGSGAANILGTGTGNLASILANIATGAGSQVAGLQGLPSLQSKQGVLGGIGQAAGGIGSLIGALSDERLKTDIHKIGVTPKGVNLYVWNWNETGRKLTGLLSGIGVIAQEVAEIIPEAVIPGKWLRVDYSKVM